MTRSLLVALVSLMWTAPAFAQLVPPRTQSVSLAGPRFGVTILDAGVVDTLQQHGIQVRPMVTQFGWQLEKQFFTRDGGVTALNEWVFLLGGLDQGVVLPSLTWMVGVRSSGGAEFGVGPNVTPLGVALALAAGTTFRAGALNVPLNIAVVPAKSGTRVSVLTGFSLKR
jgi:hypothetical protein